MRPVVPHHGLWACEDAAVRVGLWVIPRALSAGPGEPVTVPSSECARYGPCIWLLGWDWHAPPHSRPKGLRFLVTALEGRGGAALGSAPWEVRSGGNGPRRSAFSVLLHRGSAPESNMISARWHGARGLVPLSSVVNEAEWLTPLVRAPWSRAASKSGLGRYERFAFMHAYV